MEKDSVRFGHRAIRSLMFLVAIIATMSGSAANKIGTFTWANNRMTYDIYDNYTAILVDGKNGFLEDDYLFSYIDYNKKDYTVVGIADGALTGANFTKIVIQNSITYIGSKAFENCKSLKEITLPAGLQTIGNNVFTGCTSLKTINCQGLNPPSLEGEGTLTGSEINSSITVNVPYDSSEKYKAEESPFSIFTNINEVSDATLNLNRIDFELNSELLTFIPGETKELSVTLSGASKFSGVQFDLFLPEGITIAKKENGEYSATLNANNNRHKLDLNKVSNGSFRFIAYTIDYENQNPKELYKFPQDKDLISITLIVSPDFKGGIIKFANGIGSKLGETGGKYVEIESREKVYEAKIPEVPVTSIALNQTSVSLRATETASLSVTYTPANATGKSVTWSSSKTSVATVSTSGVVTAVAVGEATITATTPNGVSASCTVNVQPTLATSVKITDPEKTKLVIGETLALSASVLPELTTDKTVSWTTSDTKVATVDTNGKVTAVGAGNVTVTATCGTVSDEITLTVEKPVILITALTVTPTELVVEKGREAVLSASYEPTNPDKINLSWNSSDTKIATVNSEGVVSCLTPGTVTITVSDSESGLSATCSITVTDTLYGDANNDGNITINDAVLIVNYILERNPQGFDASRADVDMNGRINVVDVMMTIDLVLSQSQESVQTAHSAMNTRSPNEAVLFDSPIIETDGTTLIPLTLETEDTYTALQADISLPSGLEITEIIKGEKQSSNHTVQFVRLSDNIVRVIMFSSSLSELISDEVLIYIKVKIKKGDQFAGGNMELKNTIASFVNGRGMAVSDSNIEIRAFTDVEEISSDYETLVTSFEGGIKVKTSAGDNVLVFDIAGTIVASLVSTGEDYVNVCNGLYIVMVNGHSFKVIVR